MQGGVRDVDMSVHLFANCKDALVFAPGEGNAPAITNVTVSHITLSLVIQGLVTASWAFSHCYWATQGHNLGGPKLQKA